MALQGMWSGTISFSLVAIPVRLVRAVAAGRVSFRLLHNKDYSPLARRMFCPKQEELVPPEEIIRGYELGPDLYLPITAEELASVSPERSSTIEIVEFIDLKEVDPIFYDHPYYLMPLKGGEKSYRLLAEVMHRTNKAGLAKFVLAEREYLVAIKSMEGALALFTLHYSEEILPDAGMTPKEGTVQSTGKNRMKQSIQQMMTDFKPDKYADDRREKILALLKEKARGDAAVEAPLVTEVEGEGPADLIAALEEIMREVKQQK